MNLISLTSFLLIGGTLLPLGFFSIKKIVFEGRIIYAIFFLVYFLAVNATLQIVTYDVTKSTIIAESISYLKELFVLLTVVAWLVYKKRLFEKDFFLYRYDYAVILFFSIIAIFYLLPIGPATFINKTIYFKNLLMLVVMYFLGRNMTLTHSDIKYLTHFILLLIVIAFPLVLIEKLANTHFQSLIGYTDYVIAKGGEPTGSYGLQYTFQANSGDKRFAAFFASPLELATFSILAFSTSAILAMLHRSRRFLYLSTALISFVCLIFSFSRAPIAGFFMMLVFIGYLLGYWRYILAAACVVLVFLAVPLFFGSEDLRFFIIDTFTLADPSSVGHLVDWLEGVDSMLVNPEGIGMATSGNAGGVDPELQIGGENQFIVFGVQFGLLALLLYLWLVVKSIVIGKQTFLANRGGVESIVPFITATFKIAFLFSLMTANAEIYNLVAYLAWWMIGQTIRLNHAPERVKTAERLAFSQ